MSVAQREPKKLVPKMVFSADLVKRIPEQLTFDEGMEDWVTGVDLFKRALALEKR